MGWDGSDGFHRLRHNTEDYRYYGATATSYPPGFYHISGMPSRLYPPNRKRLPGRPPYVVSALRRKYAELTGAGDTENAATIGAALLLFDPAYDVASIPPLRPYKVDREHWSRTALDILRKAQKPLSAPDLARMVIEALGRDHGDRRLYMSVLCSLHATLGKMEGDVLERVGDEPKRWAITV